jgi:DNA modification methylase
MILFGGNYYTDFVPVSRCWIVWNKHTTGNFSDAELAWTNFDAVVRLYDWTWNGVSREGNRNEEGTKRVHPSQKPVGLMKKILEDFTEENEVVLDGFGGSGSTLIACEATNRTCVCIEMDADYCKDIINRYEQYTGDTAHKWKSK